MRYTSTRDVSVSVTFEEALFSGYAPDGGLYVPAFLPCVSETSQSPEPDGNIATKKTLLQSWSQIISYADLMYAVLRLFIAQDEVDEASLRRICTATVTGFDNPAHAVTVRQLHRRDNSSSKSSSVPLFVAELWHGPTHCFKDFGLRGVVNLLDYFCQKRQQRLSLLVATTGDTGPAAVQAVADNAANNISGQNLLKAIVHYPHGQISDFQRKSLTTVASPFVQIVAFDGGGDDMDAPIKTILQSSKSQQQQTDGKTLSNNASLTTGINSYNIGRPLLQMVHYIWTYLRVVEQTPSAILGETAVDMVVPTGAMGNLVAATMVAGMGVPIGKLTAAVNVNDISHRLVSTGAFHRSDVMHQTLSEAINIQVPYNAERILYYLTSGDTSLIRQWYAKMEATQKFDLPTEWRHKLQQRFASARVTDEEMCATMRRIYDSYYTDDDHQGHYLVDPHTAVALDAVRQLKMEEITDAIATNSNRPVAVMSTASPCKFEHAVVTAVGSTVWNDYVESTAFPSSARAILAKPEVPPIRYTRDKETTTLPAAQKEWEAQTRALLERFDK